MFSRLLKLPNRGTQRYILLGVLILGFLVTGITVGTIANILFDRVMNIGTAETSQPGGGARVDPPHRLQDFTLTSQTGAPMSLSDLRGRAVLMFFGYTHCPDVCPTTLANYTRVKQALGGVADKVAFVFISVDGTRDTPDVLARFLHQFDDAFIGLTADEATLRQIGAEYGLLFQQDTDNATQVQGDQHGHGHDDTLDTQNYFVQHTSPSFLVDPDGYLRIVYFYGTKPEIVAQGIRQMLQ